MQNIYGLSEVEVSVTDYFIMNPLSLYRIGGLDTKCNTKSRNQTFTRQKIFAHSHAHLALKMREKHVDCELIGVCYVYLKFVRSDCAYVFCCC